MKSIFLSLILATSIICTNANAFVAYTAGAIFFKDKTLKQASGFLAAVVTGFTAYQIVSKKGYLNKSYNDGLDRNDRLLALGALTLLDNKSSEIQETIQKSLEIRYPSFPSSILSELSEKIVEALINAAKKSNNVTQYEITLEKNYVSNLVHDTNGSAEDKIRIIKDLTE